MTHTLYGARRVARFDRASTGNGFPVREGDAGNDCRGPRIPSPPDGFAHHEAGTRTPGSLRDGYTLVEVLVAAILLSVVFIAFLSLIRSGRQIDIEEVHRRRARMLIDSCFEQTTLGREQYEHLGDAAVEDVAVEIDAGNAMVGGTLDIEVGEETSVSVADAGGFGTTDIFSTPVTVTVTWSESGATKSISITKRIAEL